MALGKFQLARKVIDLLEKDLAAAGYDLLDVRVFRGGGRVQVRVYLDTPEGIDLSGCAEASRTIGMLLEESDLIGESYVIEASSPGIRRPLRTFDHFTARVGERVEVKRGPAEDPGYVRGVLLSVDEEGIRIRPDGPTPSDPEAAPEVEVRLRLEEILEANLDPEFDPQALIQADRRRRKEERQNQRRQRKVKKPPRRPKA